MKQIYYSVLALCVMWFFVLGSSTVSQAQEAEEKPRLPIAMEGVLKKPMTQQYELHLHLTNISDEPVDVDVRDLPWNPTDGPTWLLAFRLHQHRSPIKQDTPFGKFGSRRVTLLPGESIQDAIGLNDRIPMLLEEIAQFGVRLEWECPPENLKFVCKEGTAHVLVIPKADSGTADEYVIDHPVCQVKERQVGLIDIPQGHNVLFLLSTEAVMIDLAQMKTLLLQVDEYVRSCHPTWTNSWAVSFFTDRKYAGFLGEGESQSYFERGLWQQANLGQYSSQIRTLFRFPWIKEKSDAVYLSIYQLQQQAKF